MDSFHVMKYQMLMMLVMVCEMNYIGDSFSKMLREMSLEESQVSRCMILFMILHNLLQERFIVFLCLKESAISQITLKNPLIESNCIQLHPIKSLRKCTLAHPLSGHALKCYWLRVLHYHSLGKLLSSIGHLKHLRYLNLCESFFESLESLCKLWNLQVLNLDNCICLQKL